MFSDTQIANQADQFVDAKYALGDTSKGWDCLNSFLTFYRGLGVEFPVEYNGWTESNYVERFKQNPSEGVTILIEFIRSKSYPVEVPWIKGGDILIFSDGENSHPYYGIYFGNGNVFIVTGKSGLKVFPLSLLRKFLIEARRIIK